MTSVEGRPQGHRPTVGTPADQGRGGADRFVERYGGLMTEAGMPRMASRVLACLMVSDDGTMNAAQLSRQLKISPAAVSGAIQYLVQVQMVTREREPGSRRDLYRTEANAMYASIAGRDQMLAQWRTVLTEGADAVGPDTPAGQRLTESADFLTFLAAEMDGLLERWQAHRSRRGR